MKAIKLTLLSLVSFVSISFAQQKASQKVVIVHHPYNVICVKKKLKNIYPVNRV